MTDQEMTALPEPAVDAPAAVPAGGDPTTVVADPQAGRRRRKRILALVLVGLSAILILFGGWYLTYRKPITEVIPPIGVEPVPKYAFSIYGVARPMGVAVSPSGDRIYVAETEGQRQVHVFDAKGTQVGTIVPQRSLAASRTPVYIALDPENGDVYVSDRIARTVFVYDRDGAYRRTFEPKPAIENWQPLGLAFDSQRNLYVSDLGGEKHQVEVFAGDGSLQRTIVPVGGLLYPNGLAVDASGNVYMSDSNQGRVAISAPGDRAVGSIPRGTGPGELAMPRGVALDDAHRLYVADSVSHVVQMYRIDEKTGRPRYIASFGQEGRADGAFGFPQGVATDTRGRIYVADWANDRVQVWSY
jgi:DNA-binding beta-propeller fold protein YncE